MTKISDSLAQKIARDPAGEFSVLVTLKNEKLPTVLSDKGQFVMANKIFSARITAQEIQSLESEDEIEAIEPDEEMGVL